MSSLSPKPSARRRISTDTTTAVVSSTPTIVNNKDRSVLSEGRQYQMAFAFCKKLGENTYETVQPLSPCKDYLNDVVWAEALGKSIEAYGLRYSPQNIYDGNNAYIAISIVDRKNAHTVTPQVAQWKENLAANYGNMQFFVNALEETLSVDGRTTVVKTEENMYLVTVPIFWTKYGYLISLWSLMMRIGQFYDGKVEFLTFIKTFSAFGDDTYIVKSALPKLERLLKGDRPVQKMDSLYNEGVHNAGIIGGSF